MRKIIDALRWKPLWVSHIGCIKGCIDYLGLDLSTAWLFGATGHAFIINMHESVCPSGPTAWHTEVLFKLGQNIGYNIFGVMSKKTDHDFKEKQELAWRHITSGIEKGFPCYGWELELAEFYVIYGYDDVGYYYSGPQCETGKGPKPWQEIGVSKIGSLEMYSVRPGSPSNDRFIIKEAFKFAWEHARNPEIWIFPNYRSGLTGFDLWIQALKDGKAEGFGMAYNAAVWNECRYYAVHFLEEAKERLGGVTKPLFDEAKEQYEIVSRNLQKVADTFPFHEIKPDHIKDRDRTHSAIDCLTNARNAEASGLEIIGKIIQKS